MKLFGGFRGARTKGVAEKSAQDDSKLRESEQVNAEEPAAHAVPAAEPEITEDPAQEAGSAEEIAESEAEERSETSTDESEAEDGETEEENQRTPEERAAIEAMIAAYQKKKKRRRWIALGVIAVLAIGGFILWKSTVKPPDVVQNTSKPDSGKISPSPSARPGGTGTEDPEETPGTADPEETPEPEKMRRENVHTFLLVGREQSYGNTDTLMVGIYDEESRSVSIVSIPRDTCANVESDPKKSETKKINSVFARADMDGLKNAISDIVGFPIDCYVSVGINGFINLVNTIGGVYFDVPHYMNYDDPTQDLHIHFSPGEQYLNGYDAIKVVRWRQNNDGTNYGDIDRINTQQNFLKAVIKQCLSWSNLKNNLSDYVDIFREYVKTDLSAGNMLWYAQEVLKLDMDNIHFYTLPSDYSVNIRGFSYGLVHVDEWVSMLQEYFPVYNQPITLDDLDLISKDANGNLYATSGEIRGGYDSFLDYRDYLARLQEWNNYLDSQKQSGQTEESGEETGGNSGEPGDNAGETGSEPIDSGETAETGSGGGESAPESGGSEPQEVPDPVPDDDTNGG